MPRGSFAHCRCSTEEWFVSLKPPASLYGPQVHGLLAMQQTILLTVLASFLIRGGADRRHPRNRSRLVRGRRPSNPRRRNGHVKWAAPAGM